MTDEFNVRLGSTQARAIAEGFNGWHDMSTDGTFKTRAAIACNTMKTNILRSFKPPPICYRGNKSTVDTFYSTLLKGQSSASSINHRMALFKPAVIWVTGPSTQSVPTLCAVDGYMTELPLFKVIKHKATVELNKAYAVFLATYTFTDSTVKYSNTILTESVANIYKRKGEPFFTDVVTDLILQPTDPSFNGNARLPVAVACLLHAAVVQHMCDIDAGVKFRDKRGRQAAFDEFQSAINTVLFAT